MPAPINLVPPPAELQQAKDAAVQCLREALAIALEGDVEGAVVILLKPDGRWLEKRSAGEKMADTIGRLEIVKHGWIKEFLRR